MINNIILVGAIANDLNLKHINQFDVINVVLKVQRNFREMDTNEYKSDFIPVTFWNVYAQNIYEYCAKGDIVGVKGRLVRRQQTVGDKTIYTNEVVGERIIFIHLKSFYEKFKDLKLRDDGPEEFDEPTLEEMKKIIAIYDSKNSVKEKEESDGNDGKYGDDDFSDVDLTTEKETKETNNKKKKNNN